LRQFPSSQLSNFRKNLRLKKRGGRFPLVIWDRASLRNGEVSAVFKPLDDSIDRAAGLAVPEPEHLLHRSCECAGEPRANALENNVVLYKVENGTRLSIAPKGRPSRADGVKHEVSSGRSSTFRVVSRTPVQTVLSMGNVFSTPKTERLASRETSGCGPKRTASRISPIPFSLNCET
jgi:hypothetical protein